VGDNTPLSTQPVPPSICRQNTKCLPNCFAIKLGLGVHCLHIRRMEDELTQAPAMSAMSTNQVNPSSIAGPVSKFSMISLLNSNSNWRQRRVGLPRSGGTCRDATLLRSRSFSTWWTHPDFLTPIIPIRFVCASQGSRTFTKNDVFIELFGFPN